MGTQYIVQSTGYINQISSWYFKTPRISLKNSPGAENQGDLTNDLEYFPLAGSSAEIPFWVFVATRGWKMGEGVYKGVQSRSALYNFWGHECSKIILKYVWL